MKYEGIIKKLVAFKQEHLLAHVEDLNPKELDDFFGVLQTIDFELMDMVIFGLDCVS